MIGSRPRKVSQGNVMSTPPSAQLTENHHDADQHSVGGVPVAEDLVFDHGQIRSGRTPEQKRILLDAHTHAVTATLGVRQRTVWIYLLDLPPTNMVEYGHVLPEAGDELAWLASLETDDRSYLESLGS